MLENPPPSQSKAKMTSHTENKTRDVVQLRRFCKTEFPFERFYILYVYSNKKRTLTLRNWSSLPRPSNDGG